MVVELLHQGGVALQQPSDADRQLACAQPRERGDELVRRRDAEACDQIHGDEADADVEYRRIEHGSLYRRTSGAARNVAETNAWLSSRSLPPAPPTAIFKYVLSMPGILTSP